MDSIFRRWRASSTNPLFFLLVLLPILVPTARSRDDLDPALPSAGCNFPAIFNFGDSNSDTGAMSASFHRFPSPYGHTFFGKPSGRCSDGRVIVDFIAEKLGLPFLSAYLDSMGTNYRHGANFAASGATIQTLGTRMFELGVFSPFSLDIQLAQFEQFKARSNELYMEGKSSYIESSLPRPEDFAKALSTIDIGQNDLYFGLTSTTKMQLIESLPHIINLLASAVKKLYRLGGRAFWIHNTGPIGCLPYSLEHFRTNHNDLDRNGCIKSQNEVAREFNELLKEMVSQLGLQLADAALTYVDMYSVKYALISGASKHGFINPLGHCCGHNSMDCGKKVLVNGTKVLRGSCSDPSGYISWDSVHYTDAASRWISSLIINGSFSEPPAPVTEACLRSMPEV